MELFKNIRLKTGKAILSWKVASMKRKPFYINLNNIKNIGIVWDASSPEDFLLLSRFHQKMNERNISVEILGFFPGKDLPDQYTAIRYMTCLKNHEVDFFYRPISSEVTSFINNRFDVMIDINFKKLFPLLYISSLSVAGLKVGLADSEPEVSQFDLMIKLKNPVNVENYLSQVLYYLEMINSESAKTAV
jgi:hypothetical protein